MSFVSHFSIRVDKTRPGHVIGGAQLNRAAEPVRLLNPVQAAILRIFLHLSMHVGLFTDAEVNLQVKFPGEFILRLRTAFLNVICRMMNSVANHLVTSLKVNSSSLCWNICRLSVC